MDFSLDQKQRRAILDQLRSAVSSKIQKRLYAMLWLDEGKSVDDVAALLFVTPRCVRDWLRIFRNKGFEAVLVLHYKGDAGNLTPSQLDRLKSEVATGRFHCARQVQTYLLDVFGLDYSLSGVKRLLHRVGCSYHQVSGFLFKADHDKQQAFVDKYRADAPGPREKKDATSSTRVTPSGVWRPSIPVGSCEANGSTSA